MNQAKFFVVLYTLALGCLLAAPTEAAPQKLSPAEQYVLQQVAKGEWADLRARFGDKDEARTLSARFLEDLLTGMYKIHRKGVRIGYAVINEPLDLELLHIQPYVTLFNCRFQKNVTCRDTVFETHFNISSSHFEKEADFHRLKTKINFFCRNATFQDRVDLVAADIGGQLSASGARFLSPKHTADFYGLKVRREAYFNNTTFKGPVNFNNADISGNFTVREAWFSHKNGLANFTRLRVGQDAIFNQATFQGPVSFAGADIRGQFNVKKAWFLYKEIKTSFNGLRVSQDTFLTDAVFQGPVDFVAADFGGQLDARHTKFLNEAQEVNFNVMKVGQDAVFTQATFQGPVSFAGADIRGLFSARGASFLNKKRLANFNAVKVSQGAFFNNAVFHGPVDFVTADIGGQFHATGALFLSTSGPANFNAVKVGQTVFFDNATFQGPVNFATGNIGGQLIADDARFLYPDQAVKFEGLRVGQAAFFRNVTFKGKVFLTKGTYSDLFLTGVESDDSAANQPQDGVALSLRGTTVHGELRLKNFSNLASLDAQHLRVEGPCTFERLAVQNSLDLQNTTTSTLKFKDITWPENTDILKLDGLTYTSLAVEESGDSDKLNKVDSLLILVEKSAFNPQNYIQLENYCKRTGQPDWADTVFITMKDRELASMSWYNPWRGFEWLFWGRLTGYGRHPSRAFGVGLLIIALGTFFFNPRYLQGRESPRFLINLTGKHHLALLRLLISLDQFVPAMNLKVAEKWQPPGVLTWFWLKFQAISGWVLIPIGLAAIATQLK
jgi:hypothetical protein